MSGPMLEHSYRGSFSPVGWYPPSSPFAAPLSELLAPTELDLRARRSSASRILACRASSSRLWIIICCFLVVVMVSISRLPILTLGLPVYTLRAMQRMSRVPTCYLCSGRFDRHPNPTRRRYRARKRRLEPWSCRALVNATILTYMVSESGGRTTEGDRLASILGPDPTYCLTALTLK